MGGKEIKNEKTKREAGGGKRAGAIAVPLMP